MRTCILILLVALTACTSNNEISYQISPSKKNGKPALTISMEFKANPSGETVLIIQDKAWGQENLHNTLSDFTSDQVEKIIQEKDSQRIVLKHQKDLDKIKFSYTLQQDTEGNLTTRDTYRPVIQKEFFHVFSHNLFMLPRDYVPSSHEPFDVNIDWIGFPEDYNFISSFDTNILQQKIKDTDESHFHSAVFTGGDYRPYLLDIDGNKAVFGVRGNWKVFKDSMIVGVLEKTLKAQRDFWQDHSQKYFAVTMTPTYSENGYGFQGSGLTNSFATTATNNKYLDPKGLVYLFNHELQHNWTGHTIKNENEEQQYWFSEGFTEYYTLKNIAKNNIYNLDKGYFITELNKIIQSLYQSPVKEAPNSEINYKNFWSNHDYSKLPYYRGALFAFYLDNKIKEDSKGEKSLDDLMLQIKNDAVSSGQQLSHEYFLQKVNKFLIKNVRPFFDKHIINGDLYELAHIFESFGYDYNPTSPVYDLGFTFSKDRKSILDIEENSNAYKAGLRKGDQIVKRRYALDPTYEAEFWAQRGNKEIEFRFFPQKQVKIPTLKNNDPNKKALPF